MISIRKRGNTYQYCFEAGKVNGKRKQITKCGFKTKNEAYIAGQKAYDELGISCRFYDLRGNFATVSLREGCEIKDISKVLGHSRIETTENYYINCTKDNLKDVSKSFEKELGLNLVD